ncbi:MAG: SMC family ATPase, partial [bacterium]|nr:SMC family ATPase [bacterium]
MIPKRLELSNFTSYGANVPTLDFTSFHLAAVAGPNGAGKSSLLDAITWALWGTSRMGDAADPLIHTNATHMRVAFTFELNGKDYTVERTRTKKGAGRSTLALFSKNTNLTEGTIRRTQEKIVELLRMTYEVFINSSYLRQGHADEFTTKGPADRKRILADILGLSHYDALEEKAKRCGRENENRSEALDFHLTEIEAELAQKEQQEKVLSAAQTQLKQAEQSLSTTKRALDTLRAKKEATTNEQTVIETSLTRAREMQTEYTQAQQTIQEKQLELKHLRHIVERKSEIQSKLKELAEKQKLLDVARAQQDSLNRRKEEVHKLELFIEQKERDRTSKLGELNGRLQTIDHELSDLNEKIRHLQLHKDSCPTCRQIIDREKNAALLKQFSSRRDVLSVERKRITHEFSHVKSFVLPHTAKLISIRKEVEQQQKKIPDFSSLQREIETLLSFQTQALELARAGATIDEIQKTVRELTRKTTELSFVLQSMAALPQKKKAIEERLTILKEEETSLDRTLQTQEESAWV